MIAWVLALWQAEHDAVASAWAIAGFVLLVAATFFGRVVEVGREGVKLADLAEAIEDADVSPDDTTDELKAKLLDELARDWERDDWYATYQRLFSEQPTPPDAYRQARRLQHSWQSSYASAWRSTIEIFRRWLEENGWQVELLTSGDRADRLRADLVATKPNEPKFYAEVRPAVRSLRERDAKAIVNAFLPPARAGRAALVLPGDAHIDPHAEKVLLGAPIEVYLVDRSAGTVRPLRQSS